MCKGEKFVTILPPPYSFLPDEWDFIYTLNQGLKLAEVVSDPVHSTQIDEQIGQCVDVGDSVPVTQLWSFNVQGHCLTKDSFNGGALVVDLLELVAVPVKLITNPSAVGCRHHQLAATVGPFVVVNGARFAGRFWM